MSAEAEDPLISNSTNRGICRTLCVCTPGVGGSHPLLPWSRSLSRAEVYPGAGSGGQSPLTLPDGCTWNNLLYGRSDGVECAEWWNCVLDVWVRGLNHVCWGRALWDSNSSMGGLFPFWTGWWGVREVCPEGRESTNPFLDCAGYWWDRRSVI